MIDRSHELSLTRQAGKILKVTRSGLYGEPHPGVVGGFGHHAAA